MLTPPFWFSQGYTPQRQSAIQSNILEPGARPECRDFDVAAISLALHHVDAPGELLAALAGKLRAGGRLVVVDFAAETEAGAEGAPGLESIVRGEHRAKETIRHNGFGEEEIRGLLQAAGCGDVEVVPLEGVEFAGGGGHGHGHGAGDHGGGHHHGGHAHGGHGSGGHGHGHGEGQGRSFFAERKLFIARGSKL
jgi:SAM-dependent methyltransferase